MWVIISSDICKPRGCIIIPRPFYCKRFVREFFIGFLPYFFERFKTFLFRFKIPWGTVPFFIPLHNSMTIITFYGSSIGAMSCFGKSYSVSKLIKVKILFIWLLRGFWFGYDSLYLLCSSRLFRGILRRCFFDNFAFLWGFLPFYFFTSTSGL